VGVDGQLCVNNDSTHLTTYISVIVNGTGARTWGWLDMDVGHLVSWFSWQFAAWALMGSRRRVRHALLLLNGALHVGNDEKDVIPEGANSDSEDGFHLLAIVRMRSRLSCFIVLLLVGQPPMLHLTHSPFCHGRRKTNRNLQ